MRIGFISLVLVIVLGGFLYIGLPNQWAERQNKHKVTEKNTAVPHSTNQVHQAKTNKLAQPINMVSYKALYDLSLISAKPSSQLANIEGEMFFEWREECDGWITDQSYKMHYDHQEGAPTEITSHFLSWESKKDGNYRFLAKRVRGQEVIADIEGTASQSKTRALSIRYAKPENINYDGHVGTFFPTQHSMVMLQKAREGQQFFSARLFDGSDEKGPLDVTAFMSPVKSPLKETINNTDDIDHSLLTPKRWKARLAFFPLDTEESTSDYEMTLILHDNGFVSDMVIDYDQFSLRGKLKAVERITPPDCN